MIDRLMNLLDKPKMLWTGRDYIFGSGIGVLTTIIVFMLLIVISAIYFYVKYTFFSNPYGDCQFPLANPNYNKWEDRKEKRIAFFKKILRRK